MIRMRMKRILLVFAILGFSCSNPANIDVQNNKKSTKNDRRDQLGTNSSQDNLNNNRSNNPGSITDQLNQNNPNNSINSQGAIVSGGDCYKASDFICRVEIAIVKKVNEARQSSPMQYDKNLAFVARLWSQHGEISHAGFPEARMQAYQAEFGKNDIYMMAENVAGGGGDESGVPEQLAAYFFDMWWNSPGHRTNMLGDYPLIGVGVAEVEGAYFATQIFGSRE